MGGMDARNMYSNLAVNKYLHTFASRISAAYKEKRRKITARKQRTYISKYSILYMTNKL